MKFKFFISILLIFQLHVQLNATDLFQWRGESRSGIYNETGLLKEWPAEGPQLLWSFEGLVKGFSSVTIAEGKIFTTGLAESQGLVFCLDMQGKLLWKTEYGNDWTKSYAGARATLVYYQKKLYMASGYGDAICMDAATGNKIWSVDMLAKYASRTPKWGIVEAPVVLDDKVFFTPGGPDIVMVALNANNGDEIWKSKATGDSAAYCSPIIINHKGRKILVTSLTNNVVGIDPQNGNLLWQVSQKNDVSIHPNTPLYKDGMVYSMSGYKTGGVMFKIADDGNSVAELWRNSTLDVQIGGAVWIDDYIIGSGHQLDRSWQCLDAKTGNVLHKSTEIGKGVVIYADGLLYCYADNGEMGIMENDANGFTLKSKFRIVMGTEQHWAHPVINNGVLYIRHGNTLMAYNIKN
jgi:outer membrane protein assembly factor BamB